MQKLDSLFQQLSQGQRCACCAAAATMSMPDTDKFNHFYYKCGRRDNPATAMHHIIHRGDKLLRHDWRNGLPVCAECHHRIHNTGGFNKWVENFVIGVAKMDFLRELSRSGLKPVLLRRGITELEWCAEKNQELNEQLGNSIRYKCSGLPF
jgi:hypothetical protein